jgi:AcrR family transcriptional regulator
MSASSSDRGGPVTPQAPYATDSVRQRIVAAARRHFYTYGFRSVTMDDLARELGMSKKTLYAHFSSKSELLQCVMLDKFREVASDLERITARAEEDFSASLREFLGCIQGHMEEIRPAFIRDIQRQAPELFELVESNRRDLIRHYFGRLLGTGRRTQAIRDDIPAEIILEILLGSVQAIINPEKISRLGLSPKVLFSAILTVILEGVITETGRSKL